jgi:hypothetical protein
MNDANFPTGGDSGLGASGRDSSGRDPGRENAATPLSAYDLVREAATRPLAPAEQARLDEALRFDEQLREFAQLYPQLHAHTEAFAREFSRIESPGLPATLASELEAPRSDRSPLARRAAAAAVLALFAVGGWLAWRKLAQGDGPPQRAQVELAAIDLELVDGLPPADLEQKLAQNPADFTLLESYSPVVDGAIHWLDKLEDGLALARAAQRPMLLFGMYTTCPWCIEMQANGLRDETVLALAEDFVPVRIVYDSLSEEVVTKYHERGYPLFELWTPEGELAHSFPGFFDAPTFVQHLDDASTSASRRTAPPWERVRDLAREHGAARRAELAREFGPAHAAYMALSRAPLGGALPEAARDGLRRIELHAALAVSRARSAASPSEASSQLEQAEREFTATPFVADLRRVRAALDSSGEFPELRGPANAPSDGR